MASDWDADGRYEASCYQHGHLSWHTSAKSAADAELAHQVEVHRVMLGERNESPADVENVKRRKTPTRAQRRNKFPKPGKRK
jgi:hypothetical protein